MSKGFFLSFPSILLLFAFTLNVPHGFAQTKIEIDEEVKVQVFNKWYDGVVIDKNKQGKLLIRYTWIREKEEAFDRNVVRKLCEVEALDFCRTWESESGTFKIEAALKKVTDDEKVVLIKTDLEEVTVPLSKLSKKDGIYANKIKKNIDAAIARGELPAHQPELPELEQFANSFGGSATFSENQEQLQALGEVPKFLLDFDTAGVGFPLVRQRQELVAAIPVGGPDQLVLMTAQEDGFFNNGLKFQAQLYWVSLKQQKVIGSVAITSEHHAIDYDPRYKLLLTFKREGKLGDPDKDYYTLWKLMPGALEATPVVRWNGGGMNWAQNLFGKIVNDRIVVTKTSRKNYTAWDIAQKKVAYSFETRSFFDAPVVLTHDRQSLILPEDERVSVVDAATGRLKMSLPVDDRHVSGANVNSAGTKLAAITERNVYVWDLTSQNPKPTVHPAPLIASPFKSRVEWIGDDHVMGESSFERILYSLKLNLPVWSYKLDSQDSWLNRDPLKNQVIDNMFFYVAKPSGRQNVVAIGAVNLPGPKVVETTSDIDPRSLLILKEGVRVGLSIGTVSDPAKVEKWLTEKVEEVGWVLDDSAEIRLHAEMGRGKQQTVNYRPFGGRGEEFSITFTPYFANLRIKKDKTVLWQTGTSTGPPGMVSGGREQAQRETAANEKPQLEFFSKVKLDQEVLDPKYSRGFGVSLLGRNGIEVISTTPPGREDDPEAEAEKAQAEREKTLEDRSQQGTEPMPE